VFDTEMVVFEEDYCNSQYFGIYQEDPTENKDRPLYGRFCVSVDKSDFSDSTVEETAQIYTSLIISH
jgi:hypothetical protein